MASGENTKGKRTENCPACGGTGTVLLLVSTKPCEACGGTGRAAAAGSARLPQAYSRGSTGRTDSTDPADPPRASSRQAGSPPASGDLDDEETAPGYWLTIDEYDELGQLRSVTRRFVPH